MAPFFVSDFHRRVNAHAAHTKKTAKDFLPLLKDKSVSIKKFQRYRENNVSLFFCPGKNTVFQSISFLSDLEFSPPALHVAVNRIDRHSHSGLVQIAEKRKTLRKMIIKNTNTSFGYLKRTGIRYQCKIKLPQYCQTWLFDHIPAGIETIHVTFVDAAGIFYAAVIHLDVPHIRTQFFSASVVVNGSFQTAETNEIKNK